MPGATTAAGLLTLHDAETGEMVVVDSGSSKFREMFENAGTREANQRTRTFRKLGIGEVAIEQPVPTYNPSSTFPRPATSGLIETMRR